jgi:hypothetical protein
MACLEVFGSCVESSRWTSPCGYIAGGVYVGYQTVEIRGVAGVPSSVNFWGFTALQVDSRWIWHGDGGQFCRIC